MKTGCQFVSLLLLFLFGLNVLAEAGSFHSKQLREPSVETSLEHSPDCNGENQPSPGHCADPCHTGRCHFGHCSYHAVKCHFELDLHVSLQGHVTDEIAAPKCPFLKGPKRPPRYS